MGQGGPLQRIHRVQSLLWDHEISFSPQRHFLTAFPLSRPPILDGTSGCDLRQKSFYSGLRLPFPSLPPSFHPTLAASHLCSKATNYAPKSYSTFNWTHDLSANPASLLFHKLLSSQSHLDKTLFRSIPIHALRQLPGPRD